MEEAVAFLDYDPEGSLEYYLHDREMLEELSRDGLQGMINGLFWGDAECTSYKQSLFLFFLLYLFGDYRRLRVVITRLHRIREGSWVPTAADDFLEAWFAGPPPAAAASLAADLEARELPRLQELSVTLRTRAEAFTGTIRDAFRDFYKKEEEEFFLKSCEIHAEELFDPELEAQALRWEYKYLGREPGRIEQRWEIYRGRQSEWPKSS